MNILEQTLRQMPSRFSSNEFAKRAKRNGLTTREIQNGLVSHYLRNETIRDGSKRMWKKKDVVSQEYNKTEECIKHLKNLGYKILKPVNEWVEL
jgi:uncharacterized protein YnzC (UPF0291/DUF896 family)